VFWVRAFLLLSLLQKNAIEVQQIASTKQHQNKEKSERKMASESEGKSETSMNKTPKPPRKCPTVITSIPAGVKKAFSSHLSSKQTLLMLDLCSSEYGQLHLFEKWDQSKSDKVSPAVLRQMANQIESLDASYPGGLKKYINTAKKLLAGTPCRNVEGRSFELIEIHSSILITSFFREACRQ
jgi:hypothetical protein